jgi:hypothetical protein
MTPHTVLIAYDVGYDVFAELACRHRVPHTEVSLLWENRKVVFTEMAGGHVLSKCPKEAFTPLEH